MTRSILTLLAASTFVTVLAGPGCKTAGVGDPCVPEQEYVANFAGFSELETNIESKSFQCQTRVCLVNHFRGRVSCPYGQNSTAAQTCPGEPPSCTLGGAGSTAFTMPAGQQPGGPCVVPGTTTPVNPALDDTGAPIVPAPAAGQGVPAQCLDRRTVLSVYCSCRCANEQGNTNDGEPYCSCPDGYTCVPPDRIPLVSSIGAGDTGLTGYYCFKNGTEYNSDNACANACDLTMGTPAGSGNCNDAPSY